MVVTEESALDSFARPRRYPCCWIGSDAGFPADTKRLLARARDLAPQPRRGELYLRLPEDVTDPPDLVDATWPEVQVIAERSGRVGRVRLTSRRAAMNGTYANALQAVTQPRDVELRVSAMAALLQKRTREVIEGTGFASRHDVTDVMPVGSTAHGTFVGMTADYDLAVCTRHDQAALPAEAMIGCSDAIADAVCHDTGFQDFCHWAFNSRFPDLRRVTAGLRGKRSFVARYEIVLQDRPPFVFLDLNFGALQRMVAMERRVAGYLERLGPESSLRARDEIRLAKASVKAVPGLFGSAANGFRSHHIEQMVVQAFDFRSSGLEVGTFDNLIAFLDEEGHDDAGGVLSFATFAQRFPLWHPGCLTLFEAGPERWANLWNEVGGSDPTVAQDKWTLLLDAAARRFDLELSRPYS